MTILFDHFIKTNKSHLHKQYFLLPRYPIQRDGSWSIEYIVTRWSDTTSAIQSTTKLTVTAANHLEALEISGLKEPGALISVNGKADLNIRYQVNSDSRIIELGHYGSGAQ